MSHDSWPLGSYWFGWWPVCWTWIGENICNWRFCMCHPFTSIVYGMHWSCGICTICYSFFYFCCSGIFCDSSDGWVLTWLEKTFSSFLLYPDLCMVLLQKSLPFMGLVCCFSGKIFGSKFFLTPWTSGCLIPLDLVWDYACTQNFSVFPML